MQETTFFHIAVIRTSSQTPSPPSYGFHYSGMRVRGLEEPALQHMLCSMTSAHTYKCSKEQKPNRVELREGKKEQVHKTQQSTRLNKNTAEVLLAAPEPLQHSHPFYRWVIFDKAMKS